MSTQLEFFETIQNERLHKYWRGRLREWPREVFEARKDIHSNGWSMATQGAWFADLLHRDGAMTEMEYLRWKNFERRLERWEQKKLNT